MAPLVVAGGQGVVRFPGGACAPKVGSPACPKIRFLILEEQDLIFGQLILYGDRLRDPVRGGVPGLCLEARRAQGAVTPSVHRGVPKSLSVMPGRGEGIRQELGWKKVCGTAWSRI